jgi:hypothetical protein
MRSVYLLIFTLLTFPIVSNGQKLTKPRLVELLVGNWKSLGPNGEIINVLVKDTLADSIVFYKHKEKTKFKIVIRTKFTGCASAKCWSGYALVNNLLLNSGSDNQMNVEEQAYVIDTITKDYLDLYSDENCKHLRYSKLNVPIDPQKPTGCYAEGSIVQKLRNDSIKPKPTIKTK